jgi:DNA-binding FadR family transcriptional regulator
MREACQRATPADFQELHQNIKGTTEKGDFSRRVEVNLNFHRILARMSGNPIMVIVMDGVLSVLRHYIDSIGEYENAFVLPSNKRFMTFMDKPDFQGRCRGAGDEP